MMLGSIFKSHFDLKFLNCFCAGKATRQVNISVPDGCAGPSASNCYGTCVLHSWHSQCVLCKEKMLSLK